MSISGTSEGAGSSPFEPDVPGPDADPGAGQPIADPDLRKTGEAPAPSSCPSCWRCSSISC